ncbi:MAG: pyridoxamine 5'-phosphate oxidase family protein [Treponema sp.]|jgi:uncharacterized pyridoxamine 5'-phosphate oxidase family protein|nr:pyridoxamine 5'-phosphate oxidase family protein [Treponema sp.]
MKQLNFDLELEKVFRQIGEAKLAVLATSSHNIPTVRTMSIVFFDGKIYCQTSTDYLKYKQISENKNVALCIFNLQIEGIANIKGKTTEFNDFIERYKKNHEDSYKKYSALECSRLIEIIPRKIIKWDYDSEGKPSRVFLELDGKKAYSEMEKYIDLP